MVQIYRFIKLEGIRWSYHTTHPSINPYFTRFDYKYVYAFFDFQTYQQESGSNDCGVATFLNIKMICETKPIRVEDFQMPQYDPNHYR